MIVSETTSWIDCEEGDSVKQICYETYALLLEYAEIGYDYDSVTTKMGRVINNLEYELILCDDQQKYLEGIIFDLNEYRDKIEKQVRKDKRKLKIMRILGYSSLGSNAILAILFVLKN